MKRLLLIVLCAAMGGAPARADSPSGLRWLRRGDARKAAAMFQQALDRDPGDVQAAENLGQALARLGRHREAVETYRNVITIAPTRWTPYAYLADLLSEDARRWEEREEILALLKKGLERVTDPAGRTNLGLSAANFERAVGRTQAASARLKSLDSPGLSPEQRKRLLDIQERIAAEKRARALTDWPEPSVPAAAVESLRRAEQALAAGDPAAAKERAAPLRATYPAWRAARFLLARCFEELRQFDDAERELSVLVQLAPSHKEAWRRFGLILADHGGALDAERADGALRQALALEPAYYDLWLRRAQLALRRGEFTEAERALQRYRKEALADPEDPEVRRLTQALKAQSAAPARRAPSRRVEPPSDYAMEKFREAQGWLNSNDPIGLAPDLLAEALRDSPAFVDAAVLHYTRTGQVPGPTVKALGQDGEGLLELAQKILQLGHGPDQRALVRPWLDQAVQLGVGAARLERGLLRVEEKDRQGGIADLIQYVAAQANPPGLDDARAALSSAEMGRADPASVLARVRLLDGHPKEAAEALGGRCQRTTPPDRLIALGTVLEWSGDLPKAVACYREHLHRLPTAKEALERLAGIGAHAPLEVARDIERELAQAAGQGAPAAEWALARLSISRGDTGRALTRLERFLELAPSDDPNRGAARAERERISAARTQLRRDALLRQLSILLGGGVLAVVGLYWWLRGTSLLRALQRRPALYPEVARTIGELRHDVLKHRTSVLGVLGPLGPEPASREQVSRVLWEPERASDVIAAAYERLRRAARARGATLRRLSLEPTFGPLYRDLRRAEALVGRPSAPQPAGAPQALGRIDARLRQVHSERLAALLRLAPRTLLDAALVSSWIRDVETELRLRAAPWTPPVLELRRLDLEFPVERGAMVTIFSNLLRNAQEAVGGDPAGGVLVRVNEERDATGRRVLVLLIGDTAAGELTLETIERRESGRGLAIIRDLVHEWRGHLVLRREGPPIGKGVGACFPA